MTGERRGLLLVLSGPSGVGKTTVADLLLDCQGGPVGSLRRLPSVTTRPRLPGEKDGRDYDFVTWDRFAAMASRGALLESAEVYGHRYGTPRAAVEDCLRSGVDVLLVLDAWGRKQLVMTHPADLVSVFLLPPSLGELERRLRSRDRDDEATIARRLQAAREEMARSASYDYILVNASLDLTVGSLDTILRAERLRRQRPSLSAVVLPAMPGRGRTDIPPYPSA